MREMTILKTRPRPQYLMPQFYGVEWGSSLLACIQVLQTSIVRQKSAYIVVQKQIDDEQIESTLHFRNDKLSRIQVNLVTTQPFWERDEATVRFQSELLITLEQYYHELVTYYRGLLGEPSFSGSWDLPGYPQDEIATPLTIWNLQDGGFRVELEHADKELPIIVRLSSVPPFDS